MTYSPWLINEAARLAALEKCDILDTAPETDFDFIVQLASRICSTPIALVSLVADQRQWFKARVGFDVCETPLSYSVCAFTLEQSDILIIPDLIADPRTCANPLVISQPGMRFYAGARLLMSDGVAIGSLCVIDTAPRAGLSPSQKTILRDLAAEVSAKIEARSLLRQSLDLRERP